MNFFKLAVVSFLISFASGVLAQASVRERLDWSVFFADAGVAGTIVVLDAWPKNNVQFVYDPVQAARRYTPASTFKTG